MERQSIQRNRTSKHKIRHEIENKKDTATIDKQTQTPKKWCRYTNIQKRGKYKIMRRNRMSKLNNPITQLAIYRKRKTIQTTYHRHIHHHKTKRNPALSSIHLTHKHRQSTKIKHQSTK